MAQWLSTPPIEPDASKDERSKAVVIDLRKSTDIVPDDTDALNGEVLDENELNDDTLEGADDVDEEADEDDDDYSKQVSRLPGTSAE